uniref:Uncharacterized protein n=1 Tax=viral metagenome TaxID=1070528 RepID=A0A6C0BEQ7_9ZZZZ
MRVLQPIIYSAEALMYFTSLLKLETPDYNFILKSVDTIISDSKIQRYQNSNFNDGPLSNVGTVLIENYAELFQEAYLTGIDSSIFKGNKKSKRKLDKKVKLDSYDHFSIRNFGTIVNSPILKTDFAEKLNDKTLYEHMVDFIDLCVRRLENDENSGITYDYIFIIARYAVDIKTLQEKSDQYNYLQ